jgi:lysophospholipase L1-like esterase
MKTIRTILIFLLWTGLLHAQEQMPAFWEDIQAFKKQDSISFPPKNAILFIGSSTFTMWTKAQDDFPGYTIINRAFGGSSLPDLIRYVEDIIFPYQPKQIVIYCGDNDLAASDTITAQIVFERFKNLFQLIRSGMEKVPVVFVSIKPSPSRWHLKYKAVEANEMIRKYLKKKKRAKFVSVWKEMLGPDGKPLDTLFLEDKLHMNERGYTIWQKLIEPYLLK